MSLDSPASILFNIDGYSLDVKDAGSYSATNSGLLFAGRSGSVIKILSADSNGNLQVVGYGTAGTPAGGVVSIQGVSGGQAVPVNITGGSVTIGASVEVSNDVGNPLPISDGYGSITVDANNLDIRDLVFATDKVDVSGSILGAGSNIIGKVGIDQSVAGTTNRVYIGTDGYVAISGTPTFDLSAASLAALESITVQNGAGASAVNIQDGGNSITVDGTVTANAGTGTFSTNLSQYGGSAVGAGNAIHVQPGTGAIFTAAQSGAWSTRVQDGYGSVITSHAAGISRGLDVTILDGAGSPITSFGGSIAQYVEDVASTGAESMVLAGAIRQDTLSTTTSLDGDYSNLKVNSVGRLYVSATVDSSLPAGTNAIGKLSANNGIDIGDVTINNAGGGSAVNIQDGGNSITVDNAGTFAVQAAQSGIWSARLQDGYGTPIFSSITAPIGTESGLIVRNIPSGTQTISGSVAATQSGTWNINNISGTISLPTGAATETTLSTINTNTSGLSLSQGASTSGQKAVLVQGAATAAAPTYTTGTSSPLSLTTAGAVRVDGSATTQPVSGTVSITANSSVNLNQVAGNAANTGNGTAGTGTLRVAIASDNTAFSVNAAQSGTWNITNISGTVSLPTGAATEASLAKLTLTQGSTTSGQSGALIQGAVTAAAPTYTTGQTSPLSLTTAGALRVDLSAGTVSVVGTAADNTSNVSTKLPVIAARANTSAPAWTDGYVVPLSVDTAGALRITGSITANNASVSSTGAAPPASATYVGGSVTTSAPTYTTGQMNALSLTTAGSLRVADVTASSSSSVTSVTSTTSNTTLLASNTNRVMAMIFNDSTQKLYVKFGATASTTSFTVQVAAGGYYEFPRPVYTGQIDGLWAGANGAARITELT